MSAEMSGPLKLEGTALSRPTNTASTLAGDDPTAIRSRINFSWFVKLRWAAVAGQLMTIFAVEWLLEVQLPLLPLLSIVSSAAASNLCLVLWSRHQAKHDSWTERRSSALMAVVVVFDLILLTALLHVTGGPTNPFSIFYLVNLTLAVVLLRGRGAYILAALTCLCYASLFAFYQPLPPLDGLAHHSLWELWRGDDPNPDPGQLYLHGVLIAVGTSALIVVYFILRVSGELNRQERALATARQRRARSDKLEALATLSAGAAHELASPLSTIAVVARDLELQLERGLASENAVDDAKLIRAEVARCRQILDQMATEAGQTAGEEIRQLTLGDVIETTLSGLPEPDRVTVKGLDSHGDVRLFVPRQALSQTLRAILQNALDASRASSPILLDCRCQGGDVRLTAWDQGSGMPPTVVARASDPFFTTKDPGRGMGLGLFLARSVVERLGGTLVIDSVEGQGTVVTVTLPQSESGGET